MYKTEASDGAFLSKWIPQWHCGVQYLVSTGDFGLCTGASCHRGVILWAVPLGATPSQCGPRHRLRTTGVLDYYEILTGAPQGVAGRIPVRLYVCAEQTITVSYDACRPWQIVVGDIG